MPVVTYLSTVAYYEMQSVACAVPARTGEGLYVCSLIDISRKTPKVYGMSSSAIFE